MENPCTIQEIRNAFIQEIHLLSKDVLCILFSKNSYSKLDN